jgi:hypothetical protein
MVEPLLRLNPTLTSPRRRRGMATADGLFPPNGEGERAVHAQSGHRGATCRCEAENANAIPAEMTAPDIAAWIKGLPVPLAIGRNTRSDPLLVGLPGGAHRPGWSCAQVCSPFNLSVRSRSKDKRSAKSTKPSASRLSSGLSAGPPILFKLGFRKGFVGRRREEVVKGSVQQNVMFPPDAVRSSDRAD